MNFRIRYEDKNRVVKTAIISASSRGEAVKKLVDAKWIYFIEKVQN